MGNPFVHVELSTTDVSKAKTFYAKLFDWKMEDMKMPGGDYTMIGVGDGTGGGLTLQSMPGAPSMWMAYVLVEDMEQSVTKVRALGGTVVQDTTEIPGMGWFAVIVDPTGAMLGLWKSKT
jgi:predicted enzyme related to lactoylglutathione lyase